MAESRIPSTRRRWGLRPRALLSGVLALLCPTAHGLFEDEVGQHDWILQQLGRPTQLSGLTETPDRVYLGTEAGIVASVLLKDGTIRWRRSTGQTGGVRILRAGKFGIFTATESGLIQAWKGATGDLAWSLEGLGQVKDLHVVGNLLAVVRDTEVEGRSLASRQEWSLSSKTVGMKAEGKFLAAVPTADESGLCVLMASAKEAKSLLLGASDGKVQKEAALPSAVAKSLGSSDFLLVDGGVLVVVTGSKVSTVSICGGKTEVESVDLSKVGSGSFRLQRWQRTRGVVSVTNGEVTAAIGLATKGEAGPKLLKTFEGVAVIGPVFSVHEDEANKPMAVALVTAEGTQIQLMDPASGNVQPAVQAKKYKAVQHGNAELLLLYELNTGEHRTVITAADHSLACIEGTKLKWVREESLASIRQATFYARHSAESAQERAKQAGDTSLGAQLSQLPAMVGEILRQEMEVAASLSQWLVPKKSSTVNFKNLLPNAQVPSASQELRDFGADKLIVILTRASKLFALEATTSEVVWQQFLGLDAKDCPETLGWNSTTIDNCHPWMTLLPSSAAPYSELFVIGPASKSGQARKLKWLEPLTGKVLYEEAAPKDGEVVAAMALHPKGKVAKPAMPVLLIDGARSAHVLPSAVDGRQQLLEDIASHFYYYEVNTATQAVQGYSLSHTGTITRPLIELWNLELAELGQRILAAATPEHKEWDHVPVHIKGDASILFKYINPNLLAVVTEDVKGPSGLTLYTLDTVTGHVLHQSRIPGGSAPVQLVACDNWVILHYRSQKRTRFEVTVVELFQSRGDEGPWEILFPGKKVNRTKSAHHLEAPIPLQQTYILPAGVTTMAVTATTKGITPRSIIMALTTEQVFRISKDLINPRRPYPPGQDRDKTIPSQFAPTKEEETLPPYTPMLPFRPTDVLNYFNEIAPVAGIVSSPTTLESTSLVFCYGLDLFFMPVQTAKAYDVLSPAFNYILLYGSVGTVVLAFVITTVWAQQKALQDRWK